MSSKRRQSALFVKVKMERKLAIPEDKIKEYKEAFDLFDKKKKGTIGSIDIWKIMKNFGYLIDRAEVDTEVAKLDEDGEGEIEFFSKLFLLMPFPLFLIFGSKTLSFGTIMRFVLEFPIFFTLASFSFFFEM